MMVRGLGLILMLLGSVLQASTAVSAKEEPIRFKSEGWQIVGDLNIPDGLENPPVAVLLHTMWEGGRWEHVDFAKVLADAGIASLRIDLRAHGDSTNKGKFAYPEIDPEIMFKAHPDVIAAIEFLKARGGVDTKRLAIVGASYSGEIAAKAGLYGGYPKAYAILASGMISAESLFRIREAGVPLLFIYAEDDHTFAVQKAVYVKRHEAGDVWTYETGGHATGLFETQPSVMPRLANWLKEQLAK